MKKVIFICILLIAMLLAACTGTAPEPTPTPVDVNAIKTAVVQTIVANITQTAIAMPTATGTPTALPTETSLPPAPPTPQSCENSAFVSDASVMDGAQMPTGQEFIKTWKFKNTGTCSWTPGYQILWSHGEILGGQTTLLTTEVPPNSEVEISVNMKAPDKPGTYNGYWRLANKNGYPFGEVVSVVIVVIP